MNKDYYKKQGIKRIVWGGVTFIIGLAITIITYISTPEGGQYVVFAGLLAIGGVYALVGLVQYFTGWEIT